MIRLLPFALLPALAAPPPSETVVFRAGESGYHTYRIPALITTAKGTLLAFCEARKNSRSDTGDIDLVLKRSTDGGKTWSRMQIISDHGPDTIGNPCPVVDRSTGTIWLPLTGNPGNIDEKQIMVGVGTRTAWMTHSADDGVTWAEPVEITSAVKEPNWTWYATGPGNAIQLKSGRLLVPSVHARLGNAHKYYSHVIYSDDHGQTWKKGGVAGEDTDECAVVELSDGSLLMNMRSGGDRHRRATSRSRDGGMTWSEMRYDETLVEPPCEASLIRVPGKGAAGRDRLLFSNPAAEKRVSLTVRVSYDAGATWSISKRLHEGPSAYSSLAVLPDATVGCLYERGDSDPYETITFARFNMAWLTGAK
jgi:sialidase-1